MIYDDDQCEERGAGGVSGVEILARWITRRVTKLEEKVCGKSQEIEELKEKNKKLAVLCERLLDHITANVIYDTDNEQAKFRAWAENKGGI